MHGGLSSSEKYVTFVLNCVSTDTKSYDFHELMIDSSLYPQDATISSQSLPLGEHSHIP